MKSVSTCKICQSPYANEITKALLEGVSGEEIRREFNQLDYFKDKPLNPTNIHSHKKHMNPEALAETDYKVIVQREMTHDPELAALFQQKYDEKFDRLKALDELYKQRLLNLGVLQYELEQLKSIPSDQVTGADKARIQELTLSLDSALDSVGNVILKHIRTDQGPAPKNINIMYINHVKGGVEKFIEAFMDVLVTEVSDPVTQMRVKEKLIEKLDETMAPVLDVKKLTEAEYEVVEDKK